MGRADPFYGYSLILRLIIYIVVPAFAAFNFVRLRRAFHVFQLEAYKRHWFRAWCSEDRRRALFLRPYKDAKKPLVMTGRAWRTIIPAVLITVLGVLLPAGAVHLAVGAPFDILTAAVMLTLMFLLPDRVLLASDVAMTPVQAAINGRFLRQARRRLEQVDPLVIGITGSFGKTSTKFATARALGDPAEVLATPSSFNTPLGVSRTINEGLRDDHKYFVVEIGARNAGDVAEVARLVSSSIGVLTSIGPAHLESFGSIEGVTRAKYEIVQSLPAAGVAVMNVDDLRVRALADAMASGASPGPEWPEVRTDIRVIRFGLDPAARPRVTARALEVHRRGTKMMLVDEGSASSADLDTRLLGRHAVSNVLAAASVAIAAGRSLTDAAASLSGLEPVEHRLQIIEGAGGVTVIDDAYNSNPVGAAAALEVLASMPARKRVVITPGMVELGAEQAAANEELGRLAGAAADVAIFVAPLNRQALVAGASGGRADVKVVDSLAEATAILQGLIGAGDVVLFENDLPTNMKALKGNVAPGP